MDVVKRVLASYPVTPESTTTTGAITEVRTANGDYMLKRTASNSVQASFTILQQLTERDLPLVPVFLTKSGQPFVQEGDTFYYLMPKMNDVGAQQNDRLLGNDLASLHDRTLRTTPSEQKRVTEAYHVMEQTRTKAMDNMEKLATVMERPLYMSPFSYHFLDYFAMWMRALERSQQQLKRWYDKVQKEKDYRSVLCHGKPADDHYGTTSKQRGFFSLERVQYNTPVRDLRTLFWNMMRNEQESKQRAPVIWDGYGEVFRLTDAERALFESELLFPQPFYERLQSRILKERGELTRIRMLTKEVRRFQRMESFLTYVNRSYLNKGATSKQPTTQSTEEKS